MTDYMMNLRTLVEKSSDADLLREVIGFRRRTADGDGSRIGHRAGFDETKPLPPVRRNGCRDRDCETRDGTVELRIPKIRKGPTS